MVMLTACICINHLTVNMSANGLRIFVRTTSQNVAREADSQITSNSDANLLQPKQQDGACAMNVMYTQQNQHARWLGFLPAPAIR